MSLRQPVDLRFDLRALLRWQISGSKERRVENREFNGQSSDWLLEEREIRERDGEMQTGEA